MKTITRAFTAVLSCTLAASAWAWTDKPVKIFVPAPAGGTMDIVARVIGQQISTEIGQPVVIDNRPGAGGAIGLGAMLQAPGDGNTIAVIANNVLTEIPQVMKPPYDPLKDIVPLAKYGNANMILVSGVGFPAKDFNGMIEELKKRKGKASYASYAAGTISHYAGQILSDKYNLDMTHAPFPGSPPALAQLMGGQIDIMFDGMLTSTPQIKGGKLRAYGYTGPTRAKQMPDVPTMRELGLPELEFGGWVGVVGSAKLSPETRAKIQKVLEKVGKDPVVRQKLIDVALEPDLSVDTAAIERQDKIDFDRYAAIVKKFGIKAN